MYTLFLCLLIIAGVATLFWFSIAVWELLVRFVWKNPDLSILFSRDEW